MVRSLPEVKGRNNYAALGQAAIHYFVGGPVAVGPDATMNIDQSWERARSHRLVDSDG